MAFTQADIDKIDKAIANNVLEITYSDGIKIKYPGISGLKKARAFISGQIDQAAGNVNRSKQLRVNVSSGI